MDLAASQTQAVAVPGKHNRPSTRRDKPESRQVTIPPRSAAPRHGKPDRCPVISRGYVSHVNLLDTPYILWFIA